MDALIAALLASPLTDGQLSKAVAREWARREPGVDIPQERSIATKIGALKHKGAKTWWHKRPKATEALADALGVPLRALNSGPQSTGAGFAFRVFPDLPPLLPSEAPCPTEDGGQWLGSQLNDLLYRGHKTWFVVPHGAGKGLACFWARSHRPDVTVVECDTLREIQPGTLRDDVHVLIRVARPSSADDKVRWQLAQRYKASCCVLAPFALDEQRLSLSAWEQREVVLETGWRARLVQWVARRLVDVPEKWEKNADAWLMAVDPTEQLFPTPGDVLSLLRHFHTDGVPSRARSIATLARELATHAMGSDGQAFMRHRGARFAEELIRRRFTSPDVIVAPLDVQGWATLLSESPVQEVPPPKPARPKRPTDMFEETALRYGDTVVEALASHGDLLRVQRCGRLDFAPWLRLAMERECVLEAVQNGRSTWPSWALDPSRCQAVEAALDALPPTQRFKPATAAVTSDFTDVVQTATVEAVFAAAARWVALKRPPLDTKLTAELQALGAAQLNIVRDVGMGGSLGPATLPYTDAERKAWFDNAWTFSFLVPPPALEGAAPGLILPGWSTHIDTKRDSRVLDLLWNLERPMRELRGVLDKVQDIEVPHLLPLELVVAFILDGRLRTRLTQAHWQMFFQAEGAVESLCDQLAEVRDADQRAAIVTATFDAARILAGRDLKNFLQHPRRLLEHWCVDVDADRWAQLVRVHPWGALDALQRLFMMRDVPEGLPRIVLFAYGQIPPDQRGTAHSFRHMPDVLRMLDAHDIELLVGLVKNHAPPGELAAARAWEVAPDITAAEATKALRDGTLAASVWFHTSPTTRLEELIGELARSSEPLPNWAEGWLRLRLGRAGALAPHVYALLRRVTRKTHLTQ